MKKLLLTLSVLGALNANASETIEFPIIYKTLKSAFDLGMKKVICPDQRGDLVGEIRYASDSGLELVFEQSLVDRKYEVVLHRNWPKYSETQLRQSEQPQVAFEQYGRLYSDDGSIDKTIINRKTDRNLIVGQSDGSFYVAFEGTTIDAQSVPHCSQYASGSRGCWYEQKPILDSLKFKESPIFLYTNCHVDDGGIHTLEGN